MSPRGLLRSECAALASLLTILAGCGGDPFNAGTAAEEVGAPDAMADSGGTESSGHDAGSEEHDSGSIRDAVTQDVVSDDASQDVVSDDACMLRSSFPCGGMLGLPPGQFCENAGGANVATVSPPQCNTECETYNCSCFNNAFQSGDLCPEYIVMECNDAYGYVQILCYQLKD
jgi:hypothetical protein